MLKSTFVPNNPVRSAREAKRAAAAQDRGFKSEKSHATPERGGFGLVEIVVGAGIIGLVLFSLAEVSRFVFRAVDESNLKTRSIFLAEEGMEAVRYLRDAGWAADIAPLVLDADYYLTFSGGGWQLVSSATPLIDGVFERKIRFSSVYRSSVNDKIVAAGSGGAVLDPSAKKVEVKVSWTNRGRENVTTLPTYLTNLFNN